MYGAGSDSDGYGDPYGDPYMSDDSMGMSDDGMGFGGFGLGFAHTAAWAWVCRCGHENSERNRRCGRCNTWRYQGEVRRIRSSNGASAWNCRCCSNHNDAWKPGCLQFTLLRYFCRIHA
ncbi:unnamed protein product [Prorocentrum cordatum]|uniref:RanBP2-type domain-containing protein n=1 Tax=Prorocentrum cordatum TaxID=2364126 RepID=A0ABN9V536_9DINO|nr:unnamed protein product [Polarella glacialis]